MSDNHSQYYNELIAFMESEKCITTRWLSITLNIETEESIKLLEKYHHSEHPSACYTFSVVGSKDNAISIMLVNEKELKTTIDNLKLKDSKVIISDPQIYCISKINLNNQLILSQDRDQASDLLFMKHHNSDFFINNRYGRIKLPNLVVKPLGERVVRASSTSTNASEPQIKESAEAHINRMFSNRTVADSSAKAKPAAAVTNFFAKQSIEKKESIQEVKEPIATVKDNEDENKPPVVNSIETTNTNIEEEDDGEEAEWDDGTTKKDKKEIKKKAKKTIKSKESEQESEQLDSEPIEVETKKKSQPVPKVIPRGAMDDYMEDLAVIKHNQDVLDSSGVNIEVKKKKKKLVEKMFSDEKGYLVTEMVWEEMTDDEADLIPSSGTGVGTGVGTGSNRNTLKRSNETNENDDVQTKKSSTLSSNTVNSKAKKVIPAATGQKNMMSFFTKK